MMSSAIFGSINSIALPFYVFRPGLSKPVPREVLAKVVGRDCNLDRIIDAIRGELRGRPYDLVAVAGGWQHRTESVLPMRHQPRPGLKRKRRLVDDLATT